MKRLIVCALAIIALCGNPLYAAEDELVEQVKQLIEVQKQQSELIKKLAAEVDGLKSQLAGVEKTQSVIKTEVEVAKETNESNSWTDKVDFFADLRYRIENVDRDDVHSRFRHRIRARAGVKAQLSESSDLVFQIATGTGTPTSTNQTWDNGFSQKNAWIDLAYANWHPVRAPGFELTAGKMKNPFIRVGGNEILWDNDMRPEGIAAIYGKQLGRVTPIVKSAVLWMDERKGSSDSIMWAAQGALRYDLADSGAYIMGGAGILHYQNLLERPTLFDDENSFGNTTVLSDPTDPDSDRLYANDYSLVQLFGEAGFSLGNIPMGLIGEFVTNTEADDEDDGWIVGLSVGECKEPGSWGLRYFYKNLEADATIGALTGSDFMGGGSDVKGHELGLSYQLSEKVQMTGTYFLGEVGVNDGIDYNGFLLDTKWKF